MAEASWPASTYNSGAVTEAEYEKLAARFCDDGLYGTPLDPAPVVAGLGLEVLVPAGLYGSLRGFAWASGATDVPLSISANASGSTRIDRSVLRLDRSTWNVRAAIREGTPGAGPPALVRELWDTGVYELLMGDVTVADGGTFVTVLPRPLFVGSRIRAEMSTVHDLYAPLGAVSYEPDAGRWVGWTGTQWVRVYEDTGWVNLQTTGATAGPDAPAWTNNSLSRVRKRNGHVHVRLAVRRWNSNGVGLGDADGSAPFLLPAEFRPEVQEVGFGFHSRSPVAVRAEPDGAVRIFPLESDIPSGRTVQAGIDYLV